MNGAWIEVEGAHHPLLALPYGNRGDTPSFIVLCPSCGNVWARMFNPNHAKMWMCWRRECRKCTVSKVWSFLPGSLVDLADGIDEVMPTTLWVRELEIEMKEIESGNDPDLSGAKRSLGG